MAHEHTSPLISKVISRWDENLVKDAKVNSQFKYKGKLHALLLVERRSKISHYSWERWIHVTDDTNCILLLSIVGITIIALNYEIFSKRNWKKFKEEIFMQVLQKFKKLFKFSFNVKFFFYPWKFTQLFKFDLTFDSIHFN